MECRDILFYKMRTTSYAVKRLFIGSCRKPVDGRIWFYDSILCVLGSIVGQENFFPHETEQFVRLFRYGVVALDIYRVTVLPNGSHILRNAK